MIHITFYNMHGPTKAMFFKLTNLGFMCNSLSNEDIDCSVNDCHYDSWHALHPQKAKPKKGCDFNISSPSLIKSCRLGWKLKQLLKKTSRHIEPGHASCYVGLQIKQDQTGLDRSAS